LLELYLESTVFQDLIKSATMNVELDSFDFFAFDKMGSAMLFFLPKPTEWAPAAALLSMLVDSEEKGKD
jgi:hypothetical protein